MSSSCNVDHLRLESVLNQLLGRHARAACCCTTDGDTGTLTAEEYAAVSNAVIRRKKEFAAGRSAARRAMHKLHLPSASVPANDDRSPRWPSDLVGSIAHCQTTCIAIVALRKHWQSVGVDVEPDLDLPRDLWELICHPDELQRIEELPMAERSRWVTRLFCAKEAYYKWVYPQTRTPMDFHDAIIEIQPTLNDTRFVARPLSREAAGVTPAGFEGTLITTQGLIISLMIH